MRNACDPLRRYPQIHPLRNSRSQPAKHQREPAETIEQFQRDKLREITTVGELVQAILDYENARMAMTGRKTSYFPKFKERLRELRNNTVPTAEEVKPKRELFVRDLSLSEQSHVDSLKAILECDELEVEFSKNGPVLDRLDENPTAIEFFDEFDNVALGSSLRECNIWFTELSCRWRAKTGSPELGGEFRLRNLYDSILLPPPQFTPETAGESDLELYGQLRVVETPSHILSIPRSSAPH